MTNRFRLYLLVAFTAMGVAGSLPATAQVSKADGKAWGDKCIVTAKPGSSGPGPSLTAMERCCENAAKEANAACKQDPSNVVCVNTVKICKEMVKCDWKLDQCKIKAMETDKNCSTEKCKSCTSDYKSCHDAALN